MIAPPKPDLVTVNIDGQEIAVPKGTNVIEAARLVGVDVPHYCYHPKLSIVGNCRMCLVEMGLPAVDPATKAPVIDPATGKQKINWIPRPQIGCGTNASPGLHIRTTSPLVKDCREGVMEFLLINHPLDCPICDQAGECKLQEQATGYGRGYSRYIEQKNVKPKRTQLGPRVTLDDERCILCSRCIRFCKEIVKDDVLGFIDRGSYSTLTCFPGRELANNYSLNTVDLCPVGALTSSDFRFKMRVWFLKQTNSIDTESSAGANTIVWSREGVIYRITPRTNNEVNDDWMADSGRVLYKQVNSPDRLLAPKVDGADATADAAFAAAAEIFRSVGPALAAGRENPGTAAAADERQPSKVAGSVAASVSEPSSRKVAEAAGPALAAGRETPIALVASGRSTVEEHFLARKLAAALGASVHLVSHVGQGDGILISADRTPNVRGTLVTGLVDKLHHGAATPSSRPAGETLPSGSARSLPAAASGEGRVSAAPAIPTGRDEVVAAPRASAVGGHPGSAVAAGLHALGAAIDAGQVKIVISLGEDLLAAGVTAGQLAKVQVVYLGTHANPTTVAARVVIPTRTVFEKHGTFINQQFRIQKFHRAIPGPVGALDDLAALAQLVALAGSRGSDVAGLGEAGPGAATPATAASRGRSGSASAATATAVAASTARAQGALLPTEINALWKLIAAEVPALGTMTFASIPATGLLLDGAPWADQPFVEGEGLHFKGPSRADNPLASKPATPDNS